MEAWHGVYVNFSNPAVQSLVYIMKLGICLDQHQRTSLGNSC